MDKTIYTYEDFDYYNQCLEQIELEIANSSLNESELIDELNEEEKSNMVKHAAIGGGVGAVISLGIDAFRINNGANAAKKFVNDYVETQHRAVAITPKIFGKEGAKNTAKSFSSSKGVKSFIIKNAAKPALAKAAILGLVSAGVIVAAKLLIRAAKKRHDVANSGDADKIKKAKIEFDAAAEKLRDEKAKAKEKWDKASPEKKSEIMKKIN